MGSAKKTGTYKGTRKTDKMTEQEFQSVIEHVKGELRKQLWSTMVYENGYPVKVVPQSTIEGLQGVCRYEDYIREHWTKEIEQTKKEQQELIDRHPELREPSWEKRNFPCTDADNNYPM